MPINHQTSTYPKRREDRPPEDVLSKKTLQIEHKTFDIQYRQNRGGRFVKITESNKGRFNTIIIPESGLAGLMQELAELVNEGAGPR